MEMMRDLFNLCKDMVTGSNTFLPNVEQTQPIQSAVHARGVVNNIDVALTEIFNIDIDPSLGESLVIHPVTGSNNRVVFVAVALIDASKYYNSDRTFHKLDTVINAFGVDSECVIIIRNKDEFRRHSVDRATDLAEFIYRVCLHLKCEYHLIPDNAILVASTYIAAAIVNEYFPDRMNNINDIIRFTMDFMPIDETSDDNFDEHDYTKYIRDSMITMTTSYNKLYDINYLYGILTRNSRISRVI